MCDNSATVSTIMRPGVTGRTNYYTNWLRFGCKQFLDKVSVPMWVSTNDQTADTMTKAKETARTSRVSPVRRWGHQNTGNFVWHFKRKLRGTTGNAATADVVCGSMGLVLSICRVCGRHHAVQTDRGPG